MAQHQLPPTNIRALIQKTIGQISPLMSDDPSNFSKLLSETANQESHYGQLAPQNPFQLNKPFLNEMQKTKYTPQLGYLGAKRNPDGSFVISDPNTATILASMQYAIHPSNPNENLKSLQGRANVWKQYYNTKAGAGTPEKYMQTNSEDPNEPQ